MKFNLAFIGFGVVGQSFAQILTRKRDLLRRKHNLEYEVVAISDVKKGSVLDETGLNLPSILDLVRKTGSIEGYGGGARGLTHIRESLTLGRHVITSSEKRRCAKHDY